ncbi:MAG: hypothetical protein WAM65_20090, partial [Candidatus Korobacteraceae bacterium]
FEGDGLQAVRKHPKVNPALAAEGPRRNIIKFLPRNFSPSPGNKTPIRRFAMVTRIRGARNEPSQT